MAAAAQITREEILKLNALGERPDSYKIFALTNGKPKLVWESQEGTQTDLFKLKADEILLGGMRGCGKSQALIAWMSEPIQHATYRGVIFRFEQKANQEFLKEAAAIYQKMGARARERGTEFVFPSGATITTAHLKDARSAEAVKGWNVHRIGIEEATQIPDRQLYLDILATLRGPNPDGIPELRSRICSTANPDGPLNLFLRNRFMEAHYEDRPEKKIPGRVVFTDPVERRTRVYIPGNRYENKILLKQKPHYYEEMKSQPLWKQEAWIHGNWYAPAGQFFPEFRPNGPVINDDDGQMEPPEANHVIPAIDIPPYAHRWASMDWGYNHHCATYWGARNPSDRRIHVYREMVVRKMGSDIVGAEFAKRSRPDLEANENLHIALYLSHEAFDSKDNQKTIAQQITLGIQTILGPDSAFLAKYNREEEEMHKHDPERALRMLLRRRSEFGNRVRVTVRKCNPNREGGWSQLRNLLRWKPITEQVQPNMEYAQELAGVSLEAYHGYMERFQAPKADEVLPGILIHDCCPILIETIPRAISDKEKGKPDDVRKWESDEDTIGDDPLDSVRFLVMGYQEYEQNTPFPAWLEAEMAKRGAQELDDINIRIQMAAQLKAKYEKNVEQPKMNGSLPRGSTFLRMPPPQEFRESEFWG